MLMIVVYLRKKSTQGIEAKAVLVSCRGMQCLEHAREITSKVHRDYVNGKGIQDTAFVAWKPYSVGVKGVSRILFE